MRFEKIRFELSNIFNLVCVFLKYHYWSNYFSNNFYFSFKDRSYSQMGHVIQPC